MTISYFVQAFILGLAYAMPIGPQNVFVIGSAFQLGLPRAFITAAIVSFMDFSLALACFLGVGFLIDDHPVIRTLVLAFGAVFLSWIGIKLLRTRPENYDKIDNTQFNLGRIIRFAFILTWFNPQAIIDGSLLFGGYRASLPPEAILPFIFGFALASPVWFFSLTSIVGALQKQLPSQFFLRVNQLCGIILMIYAGKLAYEAWSMMVQVGWL